MTAIVAALVVLVSVFSMSTPTAQAAEATRAGASSAADVRATAWTPVVSPFYTDLERRFPNVDTEQRNLLIDLCPSKRLCVAAGEGNGLHTVYYLYYCTERSLTNFIGDGSAKNAQTDSATAHLLNQNRVIRVSLEPDPDPVRIDWDPIYYIDPC
ncbi:hypothetical protein CA850_24505 [Micromonospora echinospora]|uniref:Peptidase inhibitor family I36 n=1 Tax=Micromonospora echinospora TaxID=1877 RepID=A0A1C4YZ21_MICEC|nr:hypothetical protein [Micromonospora echinospora]OZV77171.1 hypothetical protein CA850_24505 [Micromonospora echinospora]SCF25934.1 hypothetical protein GA0070618_4564 [Micromonospora echinospora]